MYFKLSALGEWSRQFKGKEPGRTTRVKGQKQVMALTPQYKVNQLAKDLGLKSKDMQELLAGKGIDVKQQASLSAEEFGVLMDSLTKENQLDNIGDYLDGITYIPSRKAKQEKADAAKTDSEADKKEAAVAGKETAASGKDSAVSGNVNAPAAATAKAPAPAKAEQPVKAEKPEKTEAASAAAPETVAADKTAAPAKAEKPADARKSDNGEKAEKDEKSEKEETAAKTPAQPTTPAKPGMAPKAPGTRPLYTGNPYSPGSGAGAQRVPYTGDPYHPGRPAPAAGAPRTQGSPAARPQNGQRPAGTGTSPRPQNQNGAAQGQSRPQNGTAAQTRTPQSPFSGRPAYGQENARPQGGNFGTQNRPGQGAFGQNRPAQQTGGYGGQNRFGQGGGYGSQRPQNGNRGGMRSGGGDFDKDERVQNAPKEKFQPQVIVRAQTPKGGMQNQKERGAVRVVDTRGDSIDMSKYDERLDNFVPDTVKDDRGGMQKLKKGQNNADRTPGKGGKGGKPAFGQKKAVAPVVKQQLHITVPDEITVGELASRLKVTAGEVVKKLMMMGTMATVNQYIDYDTAFLIADELGAVVTKEVVVTIEDKLFGDAQAQEDSADELVERAPVVCVMGHVDHGKTSLLDKIRNSHVTAGEAGGITQHIGAYRVKVKGKEITFLDTPGHEAFTAMRARGAQATDIAILVVAADDGIMPQTVEAINHAKAAGIDIVVAINKMDKPGANPDNIKQELTKYDLVPEEWGGDVICCPVSALTGQGIDDLLESVLLVAEVKELKANPNRRAKGIVIEAKLDKGRGPVATVLVQNGTLHPGDIVIAGTAVGRVRVMNDHNGRALKSAGPSVPVEIMGLAEVPEAGDEFNAVEDEKMARELADQRREKAKEANFKANARASLNELFAQISEGVKNLNIIVKADVGGSAEAVKNSLEKLSNEEVRVCVIHSAAGAINEGDVMFAAASNAIIVGFNVRPDKAATDSAERQGVEIRTYRVIYECIEEITAAMKGMLAPKFREVINGHAEVRQLIHIPNVGFIAGSYITDGKVLRSSQIRVLREGVVVFEDKIASLKRFKDDAKEVAQGFECGIGLERFNDMKVGDVLEAFTMEQIEA